MLSLSQTLWMQGERTSWVKVKNRKYSQSMGREELFKKRSAKRQNWRIVSSRLLKNYS